MKTTTSPYRVIYALYTIWRSSICLQIKPSGFCFGSVVSHSIAALCAGECAGFGDAEGSSTAICAELTSRVDGLDEEMDSSRMAAAYAVHHDWG